MCQSSNLTSDRVGSIVTVKHIEVQLANLPTYFGINETQNVKEYSQLGGGWICVYVPGASLISPYLIMMLASLRILCMNLTRMSSALVPGLKVGAYSQTNNRSTIIQYGVVDTSRYSDTPAGNNMRIHCAPVSQAQSW